MRVSLLHFAGLKQSWLLPLVNLLFTIEKIGRGLNKIEFFTLDISYTVSYLGGNAG